MIENGIWYLIAAAFATVVMVQIIMWLAWKICKGRKLHGILLLEIDPEEECAEEKLRDVGMRLRTDFDWETVQLGVICPGTGIGKEICRRYCREQGIPLLESREEIPHYF